MEESIRSFATQFSYVPEIVNKEKLAPEYNRFIICGMGGSALPASLIAMWHPELSITIHRDYGLPHIAEQDLSKTLIITCSYSGNTEETIDAFETAIKLGISVAVVTTGEKLLTFAKEAEVPYIVLPKTGIQPRMATGHIALAFSALMRHGDMTRGFDSLEQTLDPSLYEKPTKDIAKALHGKVPVVYASTKNWAVAQIWKIKFNETGKIPAFWNVIPEMNHNEMTGFDTQGSTDTLSKNFHFIILKDPSDEARIQKRMEVLEKLYIDRGFSVTNVPFETVDTYHRTFASLLMADWTAYHLATSYNVDPEQVPMVEEFKKLIVK